MHGPAVGVTPVFIPSQWSKLNNLLVFTHFTFLLNLRRELKILVSYSWHLTIYRNLLFFIA